jgi:Uma2 family endonuclease
MDGSTALVPGLAHDRIPVPALRRFSIREFAVMVEAGVFARDEGRVELAGGHIIMAPSEGPRHVSVGARLNRIWTPVLVASPALSARIGYYPSSTVILPGTGSVRAPDGLLCPLGIFEGGRWPHAVECHLAIECADTSLAYDEGTKREDYAQAGLPELWIVRIPHRDVRVCRGPQPDGSWRSADLFAADARIAPLAAPELEIKVGALFE